MKFRLFAILVLLLLALPQIAEAKSALIDLDGNIIVPPNYELIVRTSENRYILFKENPRSSSSRLYGRIPTFKKYESALKNAILVDGNGEKVEGQLYIEAVKARLVKSKYHQKYSSVRKYDDYLIVTTKESPQNTGVLYKKEQVILPVKFGMVSYLGEDMFYAADNRYGVKKHGYLYHKSRLVKELPGWVVPSGRFRNEVVPIRSNNWAKLTKTGKVQFDVKRKNFPHYQRVTNYGEFSIVTEKVPMQNRILYGVKDSTGKYVVPPVFDNVFSRSSCYLLLRQKGRLALFNIKSRQLARFPKSVKGITNQRLPENGLIPCGFKEGPSLDYSPSGMMWGFCNIEDGKIVIPPKFRSASTFSDSRAVVSLHERFGPNSKFGVIDETGKWTVKPVYQRLYKVDKNRAIATLPDGKDLSQRWLENRDNRLFSRMLNEYNFIGMTSEDLKKVLGESNLKGNVSPRDGIRYIRYIMKGGGCTGSPQLAFELDSQRKVSGWCYYYSHFFGKNNNWVREDVAVIDPNKDRVPGNMIPKADLEVMKSNLNEFQYK